MSTNLSEQGIAAFKAKDKEQARQLLSQAVQQDPNDEQAWYYLAAAVDDLAQRKMALEKVLAINPNNTNARQVLDKTNAQLGAASGSAPPAAGSRATPPVTPQPMRQPQAPYVAAPSTDLPPPPASGFKLPVNIPDAPQYVDLPYLIAAARTLLMAGVDILRRKPGVYEAEMQKATWWRFWLLVGVGGVVAAVFGFIGAIVLEIGFSSIFGYRFNILSPIIALIFTLPVSLITLFGSCYGSHWYATKQQGGNASLVQHSYTAVLPLVPARIIANIITAFTAGLGGLISLAVSIYALTIIVDGFQSLYGVERNKAWITAAAMIVASIIVSFILYAIVGIFGNVPRIF